MLADLPDAQTTKSAAEATPRLPVVIDHECFPHIMDAIIAAAPPKSLAMLASTCRAFRDRLGFATHAEVIASEAAASEVGSWFANGWVMHCEVSFYVPGTYGRPIPHLADSFQAISSCGDIGPQDPLVAEVFKRFRFLDLTLNNENGFYCHLSLPRGIKPQYVRMPGLGATRQLSSLAPYTVFLGSGQDLSLYPRELLPPCLCHAVSLTVVLERRPCHSDSCTQHTAWSKHWHYVLHFVGADTRETSQLSPLSQSAPAACTSPRHPKVAAGMISNIDDLYSDDGGLHFEDDFEDGDDSRWAQWLSLDPVKDRVWMEKLWSYTFHIEHLSLDEYAASRNLSRAGINFERGVPYDL